jgi:hypothetical protein
MKILAKNEPLAEHPMNYTVILVMYVGVSLMSSLETVQKDPIRVTHLRKNPNQPHHQAAAVVY